MTANAAESHPVVLIIEDVIETQRVIELSLRQLSAEFHFARTGIEGLDVALRLIPNLIVLDLALPELTGDEVMQRLRKDDRTKDIPVLVVTAHGQSGMARAVMDWGADLFMEKPFLPFELKAAAEELLRRGSHTQW